jgi:hypothetical protein
VESEPPAAGAQPSGSEIGSLDYTNVRDLEPGSPKSRETPPGFGNGSTTSLSNFPALLCPRLKLRFTPACLGDGN